MNTRVSNQTKIFRNEIENANILNFLADLKVYKSQKTEVVIKCILARVWQRFQVPPLEEC